MRTRAFLLSVRIMSLVSLHEANAQIAPASPQNQQTSNSQCAFARGLEQMDAKEWDKAIPLFEASLSMEPGLGTQLLSGAVLCARGTTAGSSMVVPKDGRRSRRAAEP